MGSIKEGDANNANDDNRVHQPRTMKGGQAPGSPPNEKERKRRHNKQIDIMEDRQHSPRRAPLGENLDVAVRN